MPEYLVLWLTYAGRLILAAVCGAVVGWEREVREKRAGLRTHILICVGACLFTLVALEMSGRFVGADIMRVVQGLLLGIGFIAGGVIFTRGRSVHGLTTAAGLWVLTAVGLAVGMGFYFLGIAGTVLALVVIAVLPGVETWMHQPPEVESSVKALVSKLVARELRKKGRGADGRPEESPSPDEDGEP